MSRWTHAICDRHFALRYPNKVPTRVIEDRDNGGPPCCWCGNQTFGIYVREDPDVIPNHREHVEGLS